ncbi:MAG: PQQ-dependent sugar dehydrogenase [Woeseia sp.]|nr:PQQ-dependent sugar dehydrogenase [Woeseia sp.]NNL54053.1 PQQ-dependent sugar dehydrogenase [Woeseia sp.]
MRKTLLTFRPLLLAFMAFGGACTGASAEHPFKVSPIAKFSVPWAMTFLPDGRLLVTEKAGKLLLVTQGGEKTAVAGVPAVDYGGQGGLGDVVLHPDFADNDLIYLSYVEAGSNNTRGAVVVRGQLSLANEPTFSDSETIWRQYPKVSGRGHYGYRLTFSDDGYLFVSSGERQQFDPAQDMQANLGKILRLNDDGSVPNDNPFVDEGGVTAEIWSLGHRNPLGLAFDSAGRLWNNEMGPAGGDELNLVKRGNNYGYPIVSNGDHYGGGDIPDHDTRPEFAAPATWWTPVISPSSLIFYDGDQFPEWAGNGLIGGLSSQALIRVALDGVAAQEVARYDMGERIRAVQQGPDGAVWLLEDGRGGRLLKLTPADANQ